MKLLLLLAPLATLAFSLGSSTPPAPSPALPAGAWAADPGHSSVVFATTHLGVSRFYGRFNEVAATIELNESDLAQSHVSIEVPVESVDTNNEQRDGHLKSPDFFSAKEFPVISFESEKVSGNKDEFRVEGSLTMHGVTKKVTAECRSIGSGDTMFGDKRAGFEARFTVEPAQFGFAFMEKNPKALGPEVEVIVSLECVAQ